ncbi:MAG: glucosamine-6-phosphate deaminase, partial [Candidatus Diapherotrites archaeon]|nr:glucosamine-6-phosphate deaminase [Candidatus Diapherotrites archaeon]
MRVFVGSRELIFKSIANQIQEIVKKKSCSVIALPTGSTPIGLYKELVERFESGKIDFSNTIFLNLDEYLGLSQRNPQSYAVFLRKHFLDRVNASEKNIYLFNGKGDAKKQALEREKLAKRKGIDVCLLGIGENAHIGFNEPGAKFNSRTRAVKLSESTVSANARFFKSKKQVPKQAITMGIGTILKSRKIFLMAFGKKKASAVKKSVEGKPNEMVPASALQKHKDANFYCGSAAAQFLKSVEPVEYNGTKIFSDENLPKKKRIIFVSPHPDDSAIAAGATLSMLARHNKVWVFVMSSGHRAVYNSRSRLQKTLMRQEESSAEAKVLKTNPVFLNLEFYDDGEKTFVR